ncbi:MAG TPA: VCBS repeat-containing protein [Candidatus Polarisedimenticolia bacterium]|nr:VCBS repeat-containing protein [Candidatus Polarisedimenticolia bacterium]
MTPNAPATLLVALSIALVSPAAHASGYTFFRVSIWGQSGEPPPRFQQDPVSREFTLLFPGPVAEKGWDPVSARSLVVRGGAFLPADPVPIMRPRDPDPDWDAAGLEASLDLNGDGRSEVVRARTVLIPDRKDPSAAHQRILVEVLEGDRMLFADLLEGPSSESIRAHGVAATDFTGEGFPDIMVSFEGDRRSGIAFYSQAPLRYAGSATLRIEGFSSLFRCDGYGIFDLTRRPREFFAGLPSSALADRPGCPDARGVEGDGLAHCRYRFASPYLGWIRELTAGFIPSSRLEVFDLYFPVGKAALSPEQALDFLVPVFGGEYHMESKGAAGRRKEFLWIWQGKKATATLRAVENQGRKESVALRLQRR